MAATLSHALPSPPVHGLGGFSCSWPNADHGFDHDLIKGVDLIKGIDQASLRLGKQTLAVASDPVPRDNPGSQTKTPPEG